MSDQWRLGCTYTSEDRLTHLTEIREDGPHGGSRVVCTAPPEDARRIVEAVNDREAMEAKIDGWKESYRAAMEQAGDWHRMYAEERERRVELLAAIEAYDAERYAEGREGRISNLMKLHRETDAQPGPLWQSDAIRVWRALAALAAPAERRGEGEE